MSLFGPSKSPARDLRITILVVFLAGVASIAAFGALSWYQTSNAPSSPSPAAYLNLTITYDPSTGNCAFVPGNMTVPSGEDVQVTITNHDPTTGPLYLGWQRNVVGTRGGTEIIRSGPQSPGAVVSSVTPSDVGHTFSILDSTYNLSVPIPPAVNQTTPTIVSFQVDFSTPGSYQWGCMVNCDPSSMEMPGEMYGTLSVTA